MEETECPRDSLECVLAFDSRDWAQNERDAWIWGIVFGWDFEIEDGDTQSAMESVANQHDWDTKTQKRLHRLHEKFVAAFPKLEERRGGEE